jgi:ABC-type oligopeptide transport system ATPase subunit
MHEGELVEFGVTNELICNPNHGKTKELLNATTRLGIDVNAMIKNDTTLLKKAVII